MLFSKSFVTLTTLLPAVLATYNSSDSYKYQQWNGTYSVTETVETHVKYVTVVVSSTLR